MGATQVKRVRTASWLEDRAELIHYPNGFPQGESGFVYVHRDDAVAGYYTAPSIDGGSNETADIGAGTDRRLGRLELAADFINSDQLLCGHRPRTLLAICGSRPRLQYLL